MGLINTEKRVTVIAGAPLCENDITIARTINLVGDNHGNFIAGRDIYTSFIKAVLEEEL